MARLKLPLLLLNLVMYMSVSAETATARPSNPKDFIKSSCRATRYTVLCVQNLLGFAGVIGLSERRLAVTALSVSITRTRSCASFVKKVSRIRGIKPREFRGAQDCIENMGDSVDRLSQSVKELGHMGDDFLWRKSNVQTWVSAALTDQNTCLDGFSGACLNGKLKTAIRRRVVYVAQVICNALALFDRFASKALKLLML